jgi:hypothetical protein
MIAVPGKAATRIHPQMSQMSTDEEKHLCLSVFICDICDICDICGSDLCHRASAEGLAGTMIKAPVDSDRSSKQEQSMEHLITSEM